MYLNVLDKQFLFRSILDKYYYIIMIFLFTGEKFYVKFWYSINEKLSETNKNAKFVVQMSVLNIENKTIIL